MVKPDTSGIERAVAAVTLPYLDAPAAPGAITIDAAGSRDDIGVTIQLGFPVGRVAAEIAAHVQSELSKTAGLTADVSVTSRISPHAAQSTLAPLPDVKNIIAVASAKGGVGKSTTAVNLAAALAGEGAAVGIMDADIYGPSQPNLLGLAGQSPVSKDGKSFEPLEAFGMQSISIGFLVDQDQPIIWRGPMVTQALNQMLFQTNWRDLDYLIVDMPPGTGDTQLTLTQKVPLAGAIIVTTPQDIALLDARRGLKMFEKVNVPVLGVVENMSTYVCPECGHEASLFGEGGGEQLADESHVPLLGRLPLDIQIRREADSGQPTVISDPDGPIARRYIEIALRAAARVSLQKPDLSARLPKVVVEH
jgi:ATP-binding protein involved in chromosome partitioning